VQEAKAKTLAEVTPSLICDVSCRRQQQNSTTRSRPSRFDPGRLMRMKTRRGQLPPVALAYALPRATRAQYGMIVPTHCRSRRHRPYDGSLN
jgi:hypothetical protein